MSKVIYDETGEFSDLSDEAGAEKNIMDSLELQMATKKLSEKEKVIMQKINEGYSHREVAKELKISKNTVRGTLDKVLAIIKV